MQNLDTSIFCMQNLEISIFCTQNLEISIFCMQNLEIAIFCMQNLEIAIFCLQNLEISIFRMQKCKGRSILNIEISRFCLQNIEISRFYMQNIEISRFCVQKKGYRMVFAIICEHASTASFFASMSSDQICPASREYFRKSEHFINFPLILRVGLLECAQYRYFAIISRPNPQGI